MSSYPLLEEGKALFFSDLNKVSHLPTREIVRRIASNKRLRHVVVDQTLNMSNSKKRSIYEAIYGHKHIEIVHFVLGVDLEMVGLYLRRMKNIRDVRFYRTSLSVVPDPFTMAQLFMPNRNLQELFLSGGNMGDAVAQAVLRLVRLRCCLRCLEFFGARLTNHGVTAIGQVLQYQSMLTEVALGEPGLVIENEAGGVLARGIETNTSMKKLVIVVQQVAAAGCEQVFRSLTANTILKGVSFTLRDNGDEVSVRAARLLSENSTLTEFYLSTNNPNVTQITDALVTNESLETFGLGRLDASGIECVCNAFERNALVNNLVFKQSHITAEGVIPICSMLSNDPTLRSLNLRSCQLDDESIIALCESAQQSQSLDSLTLPFNDIGNRGAFALADFISSSPLITKLDLRNNNKIGDDGFAAFGTALERNVSLEELQLSKGRNITDRGIRALLDGVKVHPTLTKVCVDPLTNASHEDELDFYLERNKGPKHILHSNVPLSLWPLVLERADDCRYVDLDCRLKSTRYAVLLCQGKV